jgi:hypothetical protein
MPITSPAHYTNTNKTVRGTAHCLTPAILCSIILTQGCKNPRVQAIELWTVGPKICGSSVWNFNRVILFAPRVLTWLVDFWRTR